MLHERHHPSSQFETNMIVIDDSDEEDEESDWLGVQLRQAMPSVIM